MSIEQTVTLIGERRASAILRTHIAEAARPAMQAAVDAGFRVIEFTLTTPGALELIEEFSHNDDLLVGAGTVLTPEQARESVRAGARYLVSPVVDEAVIDEANSLGAAMMPGIYTPTELLRAHRRGAPLQKLFPAQEAGPGFVKAVLAPMPFLRIVPTSGVHENNAAAYLKAGAFAVGFVNTLFDPNDVAAARFDRIGQRAAKMLASLQPAKMLV